MAHPAHRRRTQDFTMAGMIGEDQELSKMRRSQGVGAKVLQWGPVANPR